MGDVQMNLTTDLPVSYALGVELDQQVKEVLSNPVSSEAQASARNENILFSHAYLTVNAVQQLERELQELRARLDNR